jgi:hypothetical protein
MSMKAGEKTHAFRCLATSATRIPITAIAKELSIHSTQIQRQVAIMLKHAERLFVFSIANVSSTRPKPVRTGKLVKNLEQELIRLVQANDPNYSQKEFCRK